MLILGHITDPTDLMRAKLRPLKRVVVVDDQVYSLYGERIEAYFAAHNVTTRMMVLPTTEENKNIELALQIAEEIHELGIDRRLDPVIAIGGGVCMDIVGFAASIYRRRTPYVRVPTTLMGYVDASVGAKSGVNFETKSDGWRKNKLGCYLPPALAILDRTFLASLDSRQVANGAAEIMKMALVKDPELFDLLERHGPQLIAHKFQQIPGEADGAEAPSRVLFLAIQTMLEELAPNLWEDSLERLVDFGHVFSMELEMAELHQNKLFHGRSDRYGLLHRPRVRARPDQRGGARPRAQRDEGPRAARVPPQVRRGHVRRGPLRARQVLVGPEDPAADGARPLAPL